MCLPGTTGISSGELRAPPFRHLVTSCRPVPPPGTAPTPGSAYGRAAPNLRPTPASSIQIDALFHPVCRRANEVIPFYAFHADVRRILYTTNAIEALNAKLRRAVRARGHFPTDEAAMKLLFLVLNRSEKEWKMPPREWCMAKAQFAVLFGERFTRAMAA